MWSQVDVQVEWMGKFVLVWCWWSQVRSKCCTHTGRCLFPTRSQYNLLMATICGSTSQTLTSKKSYLHSSCYTENFHHSTAFNHRVSNPGVTKLFQYGFSVQMHLCVVKHARLVHLKYFLWQSSLLIMVLQVFDRRTKRLVEELIDRKIVLSLRAIYQSKLTLALLDMR